MPTANQAQQGSILRNKGINKAVLHANSAAPGWTDRALQMLDLYPLQKFMVEEVREWAYANGLDEAVNDRAWGGVISKAARCGMVLHIGYRVVKNPNAHATPASYWKRIGRLEAGDIH